MQQNKVKATPTEQREEGQTVLDALRSNMRILHELAVRYEVSTNTERPQEMPSIHSPQDVYNLVGTEMAGLAQEQLRVLLLDTKNNVLGQRVIYQGNVNSTSLRPAEVLRPAIIESAPSIIVIHNHPSQDPEPSREDISVTKELHQAAQLMGITLLDHIIIAGTKYLSLAERKLMPE